MDCPKGLVDYDCQEQECECMKEGLCDHPYPVGLSLEEVREISKELEG